jgi:hypothetical protein
LESDLTNNNVARYNWITPNIYNDMRSSLKTDFAYNGVSYVAGTPGEASGPQAPATASQTSLTRASTNA